MQVRSGAPLEDKVPGGRIAPYLFARLEMRFTILQLFVSAAARLIRGRYGRKIETVDSG